MTYYSQVSDPVFQQIKHGHKIIEPRLNDAAHQKVRVGDLIVIISRLTKQEVVAKVVGMLHYSTFDDLFEAFPPGYFGAASVDEAKREVNRWYDASLETTNGVLGIKLHALRQTH